MYHDPKNVWVEIKRLVAAINLGDAHGECVHTAGYAPRSFERWRDPADLWSCPKKANKKMLAPLHGIHADSDAEAAAWCLDSYCRSAIRQPRGCPDRAMEDLSIVFYAGGELWQ